MYLVQASALDYLVGLGPGPVCTASSNALPVILYWKYYCTGQGGCEGASTLTIYVFLQKRLIKQRKPINIHGIRAERARRTALRRERRAQETYTKH